MLVAVDLVLVLILVVVVRSRVLLVVLVLVLVLVRALRGAVPPSCARVLMVRVRSQHNTLHMHSRRCRPSSAGRPPVRVCVCGCVCARTRACAYGALQ